jgi:hypothetical protein
MSVLIHVVAIGAGAIGMSALGQKQTSNLGAELFVR